LRVFAPRLLIEFVWIGFAGFVACVHVGVPYGVCTQLSFSGGRYVCWGTSFGSHSYWSLESCSCR
jgi:hypothetical protein